MIVSLTLWIYIFCQQMAACLGWITVIFFENSARSEIWGSVKPVNMQIMLPVSDMNSKSYATKQIFIAQLALLITDRWVRQDRGQRLYFCNFHIPQLFRPSFRPSLVASHLSFLSNREVYWERCWLTPLRSFTLIGKNKKRLYFHFN